jgi:hypothetical protein
MSPGDKEHPGQSQRSLPGLGKKWVYVIEIKDDVERKPVTGVTGARNGVGAKPVTRNLL